jgi:hypothetical protein
MLLPRTFWTSLLGAALFSRFGGGWAKYLKLFCFVTILSLASCGGDTATASGTDTTITQSGCTSDTDCATTSQVCDPLTQACVACMTDAQCTGGSAHCLAKACVPFVSCSNSLACTDAKGPDGQPQPVCDKSIGECSACLINTDCPEFSECIAKTCKTFQPCQNSTQCGVDQVCDATAGRCVQCLSNADCAESSLCEAGVCRSYVSCVSDKACTPLGLLCDVPKGVCARCLIDADCPDVYSCQFSGVNGTGACVLDVCTQGQGQCQSGKLVSCTPNGSGFGSPTDCAASTTCVTKNGLAACLNWACTPGTHCVGLDVVECSADGLQVVTTQTCGDSQKCVTDTCVQMVCTPSVKFCEGNVAKVCAADGLSAALGQTCSGTDVCDAGTCKQTICAANAAVCDGQKPAVCNANGTAYASEEAVCGAGSVCVSGKCETQLCPPATQFCDGATLTTCSPDGLKVSAQKDCGSGNFCGLNKAGDAACQPIVCNPGQPACNGSTATTCKSDGSGFEGTGVDCKASSKACSAGACVNLLCDPLTALYCDGKVVKKCDATGMNPTTLQTCGNGFYCASGACSQNVCTPSQPTCAGNKLATCNADGSGYSTIGNACSMGSSCSAGVCATWVCDPAGSLYCSGKTVMQCDATGLAPKSLQTCGPTSYCAAGWCNAQVCSPNAAACNGTVATTCNADGSGYTAGGTDCAGSGATCSAGLCVSSYPSCAAILTANKAAADGLYPIDPDGSGPIAAVSLFCDMKNGGLTLVANIYDSAGDDAPNDTSYVVSGWQQTASGAWASKAGTVDRAFGGGTGSAAVSLAFVQALGASAGQKNLKMCFVHQNGGDTTCRDSTDGSLTLVSYATGNPKLTAFSGDKLTYTFGRLAGLAATVDGYDTSKFVSAAQSASTANSCVPRAVGLVQEWGTLSNGMCEHGSQTCSDFAGVWNAWGCGTSFAPFATDNSELGFGKAASQATCCTSATHGPDADLSAFGFRIYVGPQAATTWTKVADWPLDAKPTGASATNGGWQSQGPGSLGGRTCWIMNSDHNDLWVPAPASFYTANHYALEVDEYLPDGYNDATFNLSNLAQAFGPTAYLYTLAKPPSGASGFSSYELAWSTPSLTWPSVAGSVVNTVKTNQWVTMRMEYDAATSTLTYSYAGQAVGQASVPVAQLAGPYARVGGTTNCCTTPLGLGWSNLRFYTKP